MIDLALAYYLSFAAILFFAAMVRPKLFWPILFFGSIVGSGLMATGVTIFDEIYVFSVVVAGLLLFMAGKAGLHRGKDRFASVWHQAIFYVFILYLSWEALRGAMILSSPGKIRWIIFFVMIGVIGFLAAKKVFFNADGKNLVLSLAAGTSLYLAYYLGYGIFTESFRGLSRFSIQPGEWSTPAYALFPLIAGIPAAMILICAQGKHFYYQSTGWLVVILGMLAGIYYDSRIAIVFIATGLLVCLPQIGIKKIAPVLFLAAIGLLSAIAVSDSSKMVRLADNFGTDLVATLRGLVLWDDSNKDIDRKVHIKAAILSINSDVVALLFGYGYRMHGYIIGPYLRELFMQRGFPEMAEKVTDNESTEGFTAFLVDTGLFGMFLLVANFIFAGYRLIIQKNNPYRLILLVSLVFAFLWLPIINILDVVLFYLLIMPNGLLFQLSGYPFRRG